ncbi:MAG: hypothetical protein BWX61_00957 [Bacteroidetes bacterium ADurb.Bin035]|jgi:hypothetical protein|nr:hypothetical protein [Bacteroidales bacterium]OQC44477.1 MAG: hypothetical protein BWX61_00957 [Bacteroidetes bacterium ADurb.Bin035]HNW21405.1 hypothetical protein [Bacteroidales bacterium]HNY75708.1 hypothetical protein [Bacteroidales bacterium]HOC40092.1 hypothetical protein [Bacteroidales bacterium]
MKKLLLFLLINMITLLSYSQQFDSRLEKHFGKDKLIFWQKNYPDSLGYYQFVLDNAVLIMDESVVKQRLGGEQVSEIEITNFDEVIKNHKLLDIFSLGIEIKPDTYQYIKVKNEPYYLYVKPGRYLWNKYQAGKQN